MKTLSDLALLYGTDKGPTGHNYTAVYAHCLEPLRSTTQKLLEIGVGQGASICMWRDYFSQALIYGADCDLQQARPTGDRTQLFTVDESRPETLQVLGSHAPFDVIIDDGSHAPEHQILAFQTLFPWVRAGGIYFCEDLQGQFWGHGKSQTPSRQSMDYFMNLAFRLQADGAGAWAQFSPDEEVNLDFWQRSIEFVHFYRYLVAIGRRR